MKQGLSMAQHSHEAEARLARLLGYLAVDPHNFNLLNDAAEAAHAAGAFDQASKLLDRAAALAEPGVREKNLRGLVAMGQGQFKQAADIFRSLVGDKPADPALYFNLAWSLAMEKTFAEALGFLDGAVTATLPQAAMLEVQLLHQLNRHEEALAAAKGHVSTHPHHSGLLAAASVIAIDMEDMAFAQSCATGAPGHPDAETTLGTLALCDDDPDLARRHFAAALAHNPASPRALIGRGLTAMLAGDHASAHHDLERGAELFNDHIGSWIAAGWARLIANDHAMARQHFERALAIDPSFSESQGSLAAIAAIEGKLAEAAKLAQVALRLDRTSFSGAFAQALISASNGDQTKAHQIIERALRTPIEPGGKTIAHSLTRHGLFA
jgi:tetratricopeptide (TPR) repeat protein